MKTIQKIGRQLLGGATIRAAFPGLVVGLWVYLTSSPVASGQGTIYFNNDVPGVVVTHVYAPLASNPGLSQIGNGSNDYPPGTTSWAGFTPIGANGLYGQYGGATTFAQLLAGPDLSSLTPLTPITTFRTGAAAGHVVPVTVMVNNTGPGGFTAVEMAAWDNSSDLYPTWTLAYPAWLHGLIAAGTSNPIGVVLTPTGPTASLSGLLGFNLFFVPEPSTLALAGLGLATLLLFRRGK